MPVESDAHHMRELAAEMVLEAAALTDELTDEEARPLLQWATAQARAAAEGMIMAPGTADAAGHDLKAALAERLAPIRRALKAVNSLTAERHELSPGEVAAELGRIRGSLPAWTSTPRAAGAAPSGQAAPGVMPRGIDDLAAHQAGMDNSAFVEAVVVYLAAAVPRRK